MTGPLCQIDEIDDFIAGEVGHAGALGSLLFIAHSEPFRLALRGMVLVMKFFHVSN